MADPKPPPYAVGYGKPPEATRFRPGQSGNPKGRPKGSRNFATVIQEELAARITVTENGRRRKITKRQAIAKQLVNKAAAGDPKAIPVLLNETRAHESQPFAAPAADALPAPEDEMVMASIIDRIREANPAAGPTEAAESLPGGEAGAAVGEELGP